MKSPATGRDIQEVIHHAFNDMPVERRGYDDAYHVEAYDDEIIIWWPEETTD